MSVKHGDKLVVTEIGPKCALKVGEIVMVGNRSWFSLLDGEQTAIEVVREDGSTVKIERGDAGAIFEDYSSEVADA